uniref:Uncharacterized protein n=1 Tax=Panagrolaimus sp. JU765 TaxID=591449 RepID=A0AC34PZI6_9BILA
MKLMIILSILLMICLMDQTFAYPAAAMNEFGYPDRQNDYYNYFNSVYKSNSYGSAYNNPVDSWQSAVVSRVMWF